MTVLREASRSAVVPVTQLAPPAVPRTGVLRSRLHDTLSTAVQRTLTLLIAPAGSGKTVLLSSWFAVRAAPERIAWLTLDRRDDDPARFWTAVLAAVRRCDPESAASALATPKRDLDEEFLPTLMNHLGEAEDPLILVIDDFDAIGDTAVLESVDYVLRHAPPQLHLVVATRSDPLLSVSRLRVRRELTEIRARALAFTAEEAGDLLAASGVHLPDEQLETLVARTEGWAAGLALAAMALEGASDPGARVAHFAGDDRAVADFLATEVLAGMPAEVHDFLVRTSVVDELCPALAEALTGRTDSSEMLEELVRTNAFVVRVGSSGRSYRCHNLFVQLLRNDLARAGSAQRQALHRRAAEWFGANQRPLEALRHAVDAEAWPLASSLIKEHWLDAFVSGQLATMSHLLIKLPPAYADEDPEVALAYAAGYLEIGRMDEADRYLELARDKGADAENDKLTEALAIVTLSRARLRGDFEAAVACAGELLEDDGADASQSTLQRPRRRALAMLLLGEAELWTDRTEEARRHLRTALAIARECEDDYVVLGCLAHLAWLEALAGRLRPANELGREAIALARLRGYATDASVAPAHLALAAAQLEWNDPAAAQSIRQAAAAIPSSANPVLNLAVALVEARIRARDEGPSGAQRGLERLQAALDRTSGPIPPSFARRLEGVVASLLLAVGEAEQAKTGIDGAERSAYTAVVEARIALASADPARAIEVLAPHTPGAVDAYLGTRVEALVLEAMAHRSRFEPDLALESLERALDLADPDGFRWRFLQAGTGLRDLLLQRIRWGTAHRALVDELLTGMERGAAQDRELLDPLTDREKTVLRYLPTLLSNAEIASELYVSINTVKAHIKSIYRKLGTSRRKDAVLRARELRLL